MTSCQNRLLRALSSADAGLVHPHLRSVRLPRSTRVIEATTPIDSLFFPEAGLFTIAGESSERENIEIAVIGPEGLLGWPALLGSTNAGHDTTVQGGDGHVLRIALDPLLAACRASVTLWSALLGFVQTLMVQMARTIASNIENTVEERLARWLLMRPDRLGVDQIMIRHDEIAVALGVRRASVTDHLHVLEGERLIRCRRGRILVRNRAALEAAAGVGYGTSEAECRRPRLLAPMIG